MVVCAQTTLPPDNLLELIKGAEAALGRGATPPNSPRLIDIDILFYDQLVWQSPNLVIPHPRLTQRSFVLVPLAEIAPHLKHPLTQKPVKEMLEELHREKQDVIKNEEETDV
jgi:2-amino-4-hydroxy-6-hydroxymethyldihydropteridine diphosphokinase